MDMQKNYKCAILVNSCDNYEDVWKPFFSLFAIMWKNCPYPIYLNTETKEFIDSRLSVTVLHPQKVTDKYGKSISWSSRLKQVLEQIEEQYVLFFLDDFFLMSEVRADVVERCLEWVDREKEIGCVNFYSDPHEPGVFAEEFAPSDLSYDYGINTMVAIWRKEFLIGLLRDENPWDFEFFATRRARRMPYKCFVHLPDFPPVFDYSIKIENGYGIYQGKWLGNNEQLFKNYGIEVDFERRGVITPEPFIQREHEKHWVFHCILNLIKHPSLIKHYCICTKNVLADKIRRFRARCFNR